MSQSVEVNCPKCEETLEVTWWTENHKVHNGIGMQTVARDHFRELDSDNCGCDLTEEEEESIFEQANEKIAKRRKPRDGRF